MFFNIGPFPRGASVVDHVLNCTLGGEFRSLYNPFKDVARGGIRIVMSRNREYVIVCVAAKCVHADGMFVRRNYSINQRML